MDERSLTAPHERAHGRAPGARAEELRLELETALGVPFTAGNRITRLANGVEYFPAMLEAIAGARRTIEFLTFVYWRGEIADRFARALAERAAHGVRVRVLLDAFGAHSMRAELIELMRRGGVEVEWFRPLSWLPWRNLRRTHRKVLVCDGELAFTGGVGIAEEWEGDARDPSEWRDTHFRVEGPATLGLRAAFIGNWLEDERIWDAGAAPPREPARAGDARVQVVSSSSAPDWNLAATMLRAVVGLAQRSLWTSQAYFVPDERMTELLCCAAARGVDVRILTPGEHIDSRLSREAGDDQVRTLLESGVKLFRYEPTVLHTKVLTLDGELAVVGSANFNHRSMLLDEEVCLLALDRALVRTLEEDMQRDLERSREVTLARWRRRPWWKRRREDLCWMIRRHL